MGKQGKRKKNLLKKFEDIDNEILSKYLYNEIYKYYVLKKSTELAKEILSKYKTVFDANVNQYKIDRYEILLELAKLRDIKVPSIDEVEVTNIDIIFRIKEFCNTEIEIVGEYTYLFDVDNEDPLLGIKIKSDKEPYYTDEYIVKIDRKYEDIIIKEFGLEALLLYKEKIKKYLNENLETIYKENMPIDEIPKALIKQKR